MVFLKFKKKALISVLDYESSKSEALYNNEKKYQQIDEVLKLITIKYEAEENKV